MEEEKKRGEYHFASHSLRKSRHHHTIVIRGFVAAALCPHASKLKKRKRKDQVRRERERENICYHSIVAVLKVHHNKRENEDGNKVSPQKLLLGFRVDVCKTRDGGANVRESR